MAYGEKYFIDYCDDFNVSRRVSILKKDYLGVATELTADTNPITITYDSDSDFMFSKIRASKAEVFMIFDTESGVDFDEFWTADEREYKIEDKEGVNVKWVGYVIPDGFQYDFTGGKYYASLNASDGLSTLESYVFVDDNQKPYGNQRLTYNDQTDSFEFPPSLILTEILRKLDLDLDLWTCVDSYEKTMLKTGDVREADPLSACYLNTKTYVKEKQNTDIPYWYGSGDEWNCKEVVENILSLFAAKLYQEDGVWRVKGHNVDVDFGTGATQRYWRKYGTNNVYLSPYEPVNDIINIPCNDTDTFLLNNDHIVRMDDVYKSFRLNYEYTFLRRGDSPFNLISNGDFSNFEDSSELSAPLNWRRFISNDAPTEKRNIRGVIITPNEFFYPRIKQGDISSPIDVGGYNKSLIIGSQVHPDLTKSSPYHSKYRGVINANRDIIKKGDECFFEIWNKYAVKKNVTILKTDTFTMIYRCVILAENGLERWFLRNTPEKDGFKLKWEKSEETGTPFKGTGVFALYDYDAVNKEGKDPFISEWYHHKENIPKAPITGTLYFAIHGLAVNPASIRGRDLNTINSDDYPLYRNDIKSQSWFGTRGVSLNGGYGYVGYDVEECEVTGIFLGIIPDENESATSQELIYYNENQEYTLQEDPITVYNGDVLDERHVSGIKVPTNTDGRNFWNDLSESFSNSSLGLLTAKEIMKQYQLPYRIFEGDLRVQNAKFGSVYTFEALPNIKFSLIRGTFNKQKQFLEGATFRQVSTDVLPDGGSEGGNNLNANWADTGLSYCQQDPNTNTGFIIIEQQDINPNSETYEDTREIVSDNQDLDICPLGQARYLYYGAQNQYLDTSLLSFNFDFLGVKTVSVNYTNKNINYLYFVSLKSLGVVERIYTTTSPNNVISDWVELEDVLIKGYLYRVLRTDYVMSEFDNFQHYFEFANRI